MVERRMEEILAVVQKRRWCEADARLLITASRASGKSVSSFAREYGLKPRRVWHWAARLRAPSSGTVRFHPVRLVEPRREECGSDAIEVVLLDGRRVRVPAGFAADDFERVLAVLERGTSC
jgi:hypothetical protein